MTLVLFHLKAFVGNVRVFARMHLKFDCSSEGNRFRIDLDEEPVKSVFYKYARKGALIVGFNICFDLARLAQKWPEGEQNEWSLILVEYSDGNENLHYPRILGFGQRVALRFADQKMHVFRHYHIGVHAESEAASHALQRGFEDSLC